MKIPAIRLKMVGHEGYIEQADDGSWWIWVRAKDGKFQGYPGVRRISTPDKQGDVIYRRHLIRKVIYTDLSQATQAVFGTKNLFIIGATGYTTLSPADCQEVGITQGKYVGAVRQLLCELTLALQDKFPQAHFGFVDGAIRTGVDEGVIAAAEKIGLPHLGFSCPLYLMGVVDDDMPVFCGSSRDDYSDKFVEALDVLICMGGRQRSFLHDINAALIYRKGLLFVDIIRSISTSGQGLKAYNADHSINDALAAFTQTVRSLSRNGSETLPELFERVTREVIDLSYTLLPAEVIF